MIELGKAGGHLAAAGSGSRDDDQRPGGLYIIIHAKARIADNQGDIAGITLDAVVAVYLDAPVL